MITEEDVQRCKDEKQGVKLVVIDTQQLFEFELPASQDLEEFLVSEKCRKECAELILNQTTDLIIHRIYTKWDPVNEEWIEP